MEPHLPLWPSADAHERKVLQELAAQSACSYQEHLEVCKLLLHLPAHDASLAVIPTVLQQSKAAN